MRLIDTSTSVARREVLRVARGVTTTLHPRRLALLREVRKAIDTGRLLLVYQPKAALASGRIVGCEALLRWDHPSRGLLPPAAFLPAVAGSFVMPAITRHVLDLALDDQAEWERAGTAVPVQVNLTARDLLEPDFASTLAERLERRGAPGTVLGVEITENDLLEDPKQACGTVAALNDLGVNVALDDFGTGYSSLARLRDLPIDEVKVDRSFISTMTEDHSSRSIVKATIDLAHDLGARVVAEGVEDVATRSVLSGLGCDDEQGYLLARPMPPAELRDWLAARPLVPLAA